MKWKLELMKLLSVFLLLLGSGTLFGQTVKTIKSDIFEVKYDESLEQPLWLKYKVLCPLGSESRSRLDFYTVDTVHTSDVEDYRNNEWDRGHLAPAAAFNCDRETLKKTFSYLNCALQHEGLNRGPWRELEEFERGLSKVFDDVWVEIEVVFDENSIELPTGATVPSKFIKKIMFNNEEFIFEFPNTNVAGEDWGHFKRID